MSIFSIQMRAEGSASSGGGLAEWLTIRSLKTSCGLALVPDGAMPGVSTTRGLRVSDSLNPDDMRAALQKNKENINPKRDKLFAVGTTMSEIDEWRQVGELKNILEEEGFGRDMPLGSIRRVVSFIQDQVGLFVQLENGELQKIAGLSPREMRRALLNADPELLKKPLLIVGLPAFGRARERMEEFLHSQVADDQLTIEHRTKFSAYVREAAVDPIGALRNFMQRLHWNTLLEQDIQAPNAVESGNGLMKVAVTGTITSFLMKFLGQPLKMLFPVTAVSSGISVGTGVFRTILGNWMTRTEKYFPEGLLRQIAFTTLITGALHVTHALVTGEPASQIFSVGGVEDYFIKDGVTALLQAAWRIPKTRSLQNWRNWRDRQNQAKDKEEGKARETEIRQMSSSVEKMDSYVMLLPYLMLIVDHQHSLFNARVGNADLHVSPYHLAMVAMMIWAGFNLKFPTLVDRLAPYTMAFDRGEAVVTSPISAAIKVVILPFVKLFGGGKVEKAPPADVAIVRDPKPAPIADRETTPENLPTTGPQSEADIPSE